MEHGLGMVAHSRLSPSRRADHHNWQTSSVPLWSRSSILVMAEVLLFPSACQVHQGLIVELQATHLTTLLRFDPFMTVKAGCDEALYSPANGQCRILCVFSSVDRLRRSLDYGHSDSRSLSSSAIPRSFAGKEYKETILSSSIMTTANHSLSFPSWQI